MNISTQRTLKNDSFVYRLLMAQAPVLLISGLVGEQLFSFAAVAAVLIVIATQIAYSLFKGQLLFSILAGIIMMLTSSALIQSQLGLVEMHFHIFASMVVFLIYQKWQPIVAALATTAIYHIGGMYVQMAGVHIGDMPFAIFSGHHSMGIMIVHCVFAIAEAAMLIYMAHLMTKASSANLNIASAIEEISANSDLSIRIENPASTAERSLNSLLDQLSSLFSDYQRIAKVLVTASHQIHEVSAEASSSVEASKHRSQEASSASEEVALSMKEVSNNSNTSAEIVRNLEKDTVNDSKQAMTIMNDMKLLAEDTESISDALQALTSDVDAITQLLQSIRSISEQTNLLALNAAIEAARAGETGRGFAVVADEVRTLAQRSSESTDEIEKVLSKLNSSVSKTVSSIESGKERTSVSVEHTLKISDGLLKRAEDVSQIAVSSQSIASDTLRQEEIISSIHEKVSTNAQAIQVLAEQMHALLDSSDDVSKVTKEYEEKASIFKI
ncbi:methyl-accepting chemotaxis protein [Marinomonas sp. C2222]|uniref:Methyl-accepting chemotaxis protein n=1 Tax=Marinomonas sargassi TaxID=2984494 RepID=A0ABT2YRP6_9GAMM|nr:methyl-accepting chemotaxis protein [Marinomonas sargassi]MCV2402566.1 methyl-accepting chemotaxis protein [Marinomonas sargassi]